MKFKLPQRLNLRGLRNVLLNLSDPATSSIELDFMNVKWCEPFPMLVLSSELSRLKFNHDVTFSNYEHLTYMGYMGFFRSFGVDFGSSPRRLKKQRYLPINILEATEIRKEARENSQRVNDYIEDLSKEWTRVLIQKSGGSLYETLAYIIRELVRNTIEHSNSDQIGYCAQYWPKNDTVELAVLDRGIGLKNSLSRNPNLKIEDDNEALALALMPGISGVAFKGAILDENDPWVNSGYGLYMTSRMSRDMGNFLIHSNGSGLILFGDRKHQMSIPIEGTQIRLKLSGLSDLDFRNQLSTYRDDAREINKNINSPSLASLMLSNNFGK